jgi:menaquinone-9 beta-reductase
MKEYDFSVIGGGPAGSFTAFLLAAEGFSVCLFEQKEFPREILCGEFLSYEVSNHLKDTGLYERFLELNPNRLTAFRLFTSKNNTALTDFRFTAFGLKRSTLDTFLLSAAEEKGVEVFQPCKAKKINKEGDYFIINAADSTGNLEIKSSRVIDATGKSRSLSQAPPENDSPYNGVKIHMDAALFDHLPKNEIHIYTGKNIYCGLNNVNESAVTLCFLEKRGDNDPPAREKFIRLKKENPAFNYLMKGATDHDIINSKVYGTGGIVFGRKDTFKDDVYRVGDAAGVIAPLAGDGIGMAMESARLLADIFIKEMTEKNAGFNPALIYAEKWKKKFRKRLSAAGLIQRTIFSSFLNPAVKLMSIYPRSINTLIDYTRK